MNQYTDEDKPEELDNRPKQLSLRKLQEEAWDDGFRKAMDVMRHMSFQDNPDWNPYR